MPEATKISARSQRVGDSGGMTATGHGMGRSPIYDDWNRTVRQHLDCLTAQHDGGDSAPAMRSHHDRVASSLFRCIDNSLIRVLVLDMDHVAGDA